MVRHSILKMSPYEELLHRWQARRDEYGRVNAMVNGAKVLDEFIADLTKVLSAEANTVLTLETAALRSGYSKEHLARLIREGTLPNAGRRGAPRIYARDLPHRAAHPALGSRSRQGYNPMTDARALGLVRPR